MKGSPEKLVAKEHAISVHHVSLAIFSDVLDTAVSVKAFNSYSGYAIELAWKSKDSTKFVHGGTRLGTELPTPVPVVLLALLACWA